MINEKTILFAVAGLIIFLLLWNLTRKHQQIKPKLAFLFKHKNNNQMKVVSSLTLTSLVAQVLALMIIDMNNNNAPIPGVLSGISVSPADPTQDSASSDDAGNVTVDAITQTGGTVVNASATFASTKLLPDGVTPVVAGSFSAQLTLVNNVVVNAALAFTQN